jgi:hypothetical protein
LAEQLKGAAPAELAKAIEELPFRLLSRLTASLSGNVDDDVF